MESYPEMMRTNLVRFVVVFVDNQVIIVEHVNSTQVVEIVEMKNLMKYGN